MKLLLAAAAALGMTTELAMTQQNEPGIGSDEQLRRAIGADTNMVTLAAIGSVQKDLGVGEDVARKLTRLGEAYQAAVRRELGDAAVLKKPFKKDQPAPEKFTADQRQEFLETRRRLHNEFIPKTTELLTTDQTKRLRQIWLQACSKSGPRRLLESDVASELQLTDDQKKALNALQAEMREKQFPGGSPVKGGREAMANLISIQEEYAKKSVDVLTVEQKAGLGKEFPFPKLAR
jgi:hypothetical protein